MKPKKILLLAAIISMMILPIQLLQIENSNCPRQIADYSSSPCCAIASERFTGGSPVSSQNELEEQAFTINTELTACVDFFVVDNLAYIIGGDGFEILNVTEPQNPERIAQYNYSSDFQPSAVSSNGEYIIVGINGEQGGCLGFIDMKDPTNLTIIEQYCFGMIKQIFVDDRYAYILEKNASWWSPFLSIVDVGNPQKPKIVSNYFYNGSVTDFFVEGSYVYTLIERQKLEILNIQEPPEPKFFGEWVSSEQLLKTIFVEGKYAYIIKFSFPRERESLLIFDISTSSPEKVGQYDGFQAYAEIRDVYISGDYAYVIDADTLTILDVSNKGNIKKKGTFRKRGLSVREDFP